MTIHTEQATCPACDGAGGFDEMCSTCNGSGEGMYDGSTCRRCKGWGGWPEPCHACEGTGLVDVDEEED